MRKIFFTILLLLIMVFSAQVYAYEILSGDEIVVLEEINDDVYIAGGIVSVISPIWGDLYIVG
jgi:hypothetical protein